MFNGKEKLLKEVRYIHEFERNLTSVGMLDKKRYSVKIEFGLLKVTKGSLTVMKEKIKNGLYTPIGKTMIGEASLVENQQV